jgi:hypothetical protein
MADGFDITELTNFEKGLLKLAHETMPKETKKFLRVEGTKLRKKTLAKAKQKVKKDTGYYLKSIKRGKVYLYRVNGALSIRVYSAAPHAHLIEDGHRQVTKDGKEVGFVQGKHVFKDSEKQFTNEYFNDVQKFIDNVLDKGL